MASGPLVVRGELAEGGVIELLRECEARRITGLLQFEGRGPDASVSGSLRLFGGEIAVDQEERPDGLDPVDVLLELESGTYLVEQSLPPLPVSQGTSTKRWGSLAVHVPVDLIRYCEHAGLTGVLQLVHRDRKAEAFYEGGELLAIELDGQDATDLNEVFSWEEGRFSITLDSDAPQRVAPDPDPVDEASRDGWAPAPPEKRESTRQFLKVVQMALVDVLDRSEKARSPTRSSPPLPPPPKKRPRPPSVPPPRPRPRDDQTVRLIYLTGEPSSTSRDVADPDTRHLQAGVQAEEVNVARAADSPADTRELMAKKRREKKRKSAERAALEPPEPGPEAGPDAAARSGDPLPRPAADTPRRAASEAPAPAGSAALIQVGVASVWALGVLGLGVLILFVLGKLPPVQ